MGLDCGAACRGGGLVACRSIRGRRQIPCDRQRNGLDISSLPGKGLRGLGRVRSACAVLQPSGRQRLVFQATGNELSWGQAPSRSLRLSSGPMEGIEGRNPMTNFQRTVSRSTLAALLMFGAMSVATFAGDLSRYRNFELGSHLATVAKQAAADPSQAKVIHSRPAHPRARMAPSTSRCILPNRIGARSSFQLLRRPTISDQS